MRWVKAPDAGRLNMGASHQEPALFTTNVGTLDRALRITAGLALIGTTLAGLIGPWGWIGVVPLATGTLRFCPAYLPFGFKTCALPAAPQQP